MPYFHTPKEKICFLKHCHFPDKVLNSFKVLYICVIVVTLFVTFTFIVQPLIEKIYFVVVCGLVIL